jgi:hypothetical protein
MRGQIAARIVAVATLLVAVSCSQSEPSSAPTNQAVDATRGPERAAGATSGAASTPDPDDALAPTPFAVPSAPAIAPGDASGADSPGRARGRGPAKLPPPQLAGRSKDVVPVESSVSPACVDRGGSVTLTVNTEPKAAIGFQAVYSDGRGGGGAPFGAGYGGNDKGIASGRGTFNATWVVSPEAPVGAGRVDVVVGYRGEFGYDGPHFAVADAKGNCPESWLGGGR